MGWLRFVGSLKIRVSFAKEPYKRHLYSAKEPYIFKHPINRSHPIVEKIFSTAGEDKAHHIDSTFVNTCVPQIRLTILCRKMQIWVKKSAFSQYSIRHFQYELSDWPGSWCFDEGRIYVVRQQRKTTFVVALSSPKLLPCLLLPY
jgi:hypothetical protein